MIDPKVELLKLLQEHPNARVVTDVGASLFSGWGDLNKVNWLPEQNAIELEFE